MTSSHRSIDLKFGRRVVTAVVRRATRQYLRIEVTPDLLVRVTAPLDADFDEVARRVNRRRSWIFRKISEIECRPPVTPARRYLSGETHVLLGRQYRLAITDSKDSCVRIEGGRIVVGLPHTEDPRVIRQLVTKFYAAEARRVFRARLDSLFAPFRRRGLTMPAIVVRHLSKRWGSFTPSGRIVLNVDLVKARTSLIDYVICHELGHAIYPDHGPKWQKLLESVMPNWETRKILLESSLR